MTSQRFFRVMLGAILSGVVWLAWCQKGMAQAVSFEQIRGIEDRIERFLEAEQARQVRPVLSLSIAVGVNGELVFARGIGNARPGTPATAETVYHIGSITKQFTAALVLQAIAQGAIIPRSGRPIGLATPMRDILDGVEHWRRDDKTDVTLLHLLTMTSNLPNFTRRLPDGEIDPWGSVAADQLLKRIKNYRPFGWPDTFEYNNTGYFVLAELLDILQWPGEREQKSRARRVREMLQALGMEQSGFAHEAFHGLVVAAPNYDGRPAFTRPDWLKGSGDMAASAVDLFRWNKALVEGRVLAPSEREIMFRAAARVSPQIWYAMGWFVEEKDGREIFSHSGSVPGYTAMNWIARPAGSDWHRWVSVSILSNGEEIEGLDVLAGDVARCVTGTAC